MKINERFLECRSRLEENLRRFTGILVYVPQLSFFSLACGCTGITANVKGLQKEEIEIFRDRILKILEEISLTLNIKPKVIYAKMVPSTPLILALNCDDLCEDCSEEYEEEVEVAPWGDMYILKQIFS